MAQFSGGAWGAASGQILVWTGRGWTGLDGAMKLLTRTASVRVAEGPARSATHMVVAEELLSGLSGASVTSAIAIPNRAIVLGVSTRTVAAITGTTSYNCGILSETSKFGGSLGIAAGSTNVGVIGPQAFYSATPDCRDRQWRKFHRRRGAHRHPLPAADRPTILICAHCSTACAWRGAPCDGRSSA